MVLMTVIKMQNAATQLAVSFAYAIKDILVMGGNAWV